MPETNGTDAESVKTIGGAVAFVVLTLAVVLLCGGIVSARKSLLLSRRGVETSGEVVAVHLVAGRHGDKCHPIVDYTDLRGLPQRREFGRAAYGKGDKVTVVYLPGRPSFAELKELVNVWADAPFVAAGSGTVALLLAVYCGFGLTAVCAARSRSRPGGPVTNDRQDIQRI